MPPKFFLIGKFCIVAGLVSVSTAHAQIASLHSNRSPPASGSYWYDYGYESGNLNRVATSSRLGGPVGVDSRVSNLGYDSKATCDPALPQASRRRMSAPDLPGAIRQAASASATVATTTSSSSVATVSRRPASQPRSMAPRPGATDSQPTGSSDYSFSLTYALARSVPVCLLFRPDARARHAEYAIHRRRKSRYLDVPRAADPVQYRDRGRLPVPLRSAVSLECVS